MAPALNDFAGALRDLNFGTVRYVLVGGIAVIRHGAVRATKDLDAAVAMDSDNLERVKSLLDRWEATNPDGSPLWTRELAPGGMLLLRTRHCLVDLLSEQLLPAPFEEVLERADHKRVDGVRAPICSLQDLVAMKRQAGRSADALDLERLREAHGTLPGDPPGVGPPRA